MFKVALSFPINYIKTYFKTYIIINASYEGICAEFEREQNIGFPTFKLSASTNLL